MAYSIQIQSIDRSNLVLRESVRVRWKLGARAAAELSAKNLSPILGRKVQFFDSGTPIFVGSVDERTTYDMGDGMTLLERMLVVGAESRLDKNIRPNDAYGKMFFTSNAISDVLTTLADHDFENGYVVGVKSTGTPPGGLSTGTPYYVINKTASSLQLSTSSGGSAVNITSDGTGTHYLVWYSGSIVRKLMAFYSTWENIGLGTIGNGVQVDLASFEWSNIWSMIEQLASLSNYVAYIDGDEDLYFVPRTAFSAPFNLSNSSTGAELMMGETRQEIWFRQTREEYANEIWVRYNESSIAPTFVNLTGDGSKRTFWVASPIKELISVLGSDDIGVWGVDSGKAWYYTPGDRWVIQDSSGTPPSGTVPVTYRAYGLDGVQVLDSSEQSARAAIEGGSGVWQAVVQDSSIQTADGATALGQSLLERYKAFPVEMRYQTRAHGIRPGQLQTVNLPFFSINTTFLIDSVDAAIDGDGEWRYTVRGISTTRLGDFLTVFRSFISGGSSVSGGGAVGGGGGGAGVIEYITQTLTTATEISHTVAQAGALLMVVLTQDGTGGHAVTWDTDEFEDVTTDVETLANARTQIMFYSTGTKWRQHGAIHVKQ